MKPRFAGCLKPNGRGRQQRQVGLAEGVTRRALRDCSGCRVTACRLVQATRYAFIGRTFCVGGRVYRANTTLVSASAGFPPPQTVRHKPARSRRGERYAVYQKIQEKICCHPPSIGLFFVFLFRLRHFTPPAFSAPATKTPARRQILPPRSARPSCPAGARKRPARQ